MRKVLVSGLVIVVAAAAAGCGSSAASGSKSKTSKPARVVSAGTTTATGASTTATTVAPNIVNISAPVSGLRFSQKVVKAHAGTINIVFRNNSSLKHNVNVEKGETELGKTASIHLGMTSISVTLKPGSYNFYCSVPGHEDAGMHGTLIVT